MGAYGQAGAYSDLELRPSLDATPLLVWGSGYVDPLTLKAHTRTKGLSVEEAEALPYEVFSNLGKGVLNGAASTAVSGIEALTTITSFGPGGYESHDLTNGALEGYRHPFQYGNSPVAQVAGTTGEFLFDAGTVAAGGASTIRGARSLGGEAANLAHGSERSTLYHYTTEGGLNGILESGELRPSLKAVNPKDARYGNGQYLTDIVPGTKTLGQLSKAFIGIPYQGRKFSHYVEIDVTGLKVVKGRNGVYVVPNETALNLTGRIVSHGASHK